MPPRVLSHDDARNAPAPCVHVSWPFAVVVECARAARWVYICMLSSVAPPGAALLIDRRGACRSARPMATKVNPQHATARRRPTARSRTQALQIVPRADRACRPPRGSPSAPTTTSQTPPAQQHGRHNDPRGGAARTDETRRRCHRLSHVEASIPARSRSPGTQWRCTAQRGCHRPTAVRSRVLRPRRRRLEAWPSRRLG